MIDWNHHPIPSTYISDPTAKFRVVSMSKKYGSGIQGYYTNYFHAKRMEKFFKDRGDSDVALEIHNPRENATGIHPLVEKAMRLF